MSVTLKSLIMHAKLSNSFGKKFYGFLRCTKVLMSHVCSCNWYNHFRHEKQHFNRLRTRNAEDCLADADNARQAGAVATGNVYQSGVCIESIRNLEAGVPIIVSRDKEPAWRKSPKLKHFLTVQEYASACLERKCRKRLKT